MLSIREEDGGEVTGVCSVCGGDIYRGEEYYRINGRSICPECLEDFARDYFRSFVCRGGERW